MVVLLAAGLRTSNSAYSPFTSTQHPTQHPGARCSSLTGPPPPLGRLRSAWPLLAWLFLYTNALMQQLSRFVSFAYAGWCTFAVLGTWVYPHLRRSSTVSARRTNGEFDVPCKWWSNAHTKSCRLLLIVSQILSTMHEVSIWVSA